MVTTPSTSRTSSKSDRKKSVPPKQAAGTAATSPAQSPGAIIAERYSDTGYEVFVGKNGENVTAAMTAGEAMLAGLAEVSQEMMTFAGDRLRQDMEIVEDFAKATSPEELFEKQCTFAQRAAQQYAEETSKLFAMFARIQQTCWAPVQERTRQALHDLNGGEVSETNK